MVARKICKREMANTDKIRWGGLAEEWDENPDFNHGDMFDDSDQTGAGNDENGTNSEQTGAGKAGLVADITDKLKGKGIKLLDISVELSEFDSILPLELLDVYLRFPFVLYKLPGLHHYYNPPGYFTQWDHALRDVIVYSTNDQRIDSFMSLHSIIPLQNDENKSFSQIFTQSAHSNCPYAIFQRYIAKNRSVFFVRCNEENGRYPSWEHLSTAFITETDVVNRLCDEHYTYAGDIGRVWLPKIADKKTITTAINSKKATFTKVERKWEHLLSCKWEGKTWKIEHRGDEPITPRMNSATRIKITCTGDANENYENLVKALKTNKVISFKWLRAVELHREQGGTWKTDDFWLLLRFVQALFDATRTKPKVRAIFSTNHNMSQILGEKKVYGSTNSITSPTSPTWFYFVMKYIILQKGEHSIPPGDNDGDGDTDTDRTNKNVSMDLPVMSDIEKVITRYANLSEAKKEKINNNQTKYDLSKLLYNGLIRSEYRYDALANWHESIMAGGNRNNHLKRVEFKTSDNNKGVNIVEISDGENSSSPYYLDHKRGDYYGLVLMNTNTHDAIPKYLIHIPESNLQPPLNANLQPPLNVKAKSYWEIVWSGLISNNNPLMTHTCVFHLRTDKHIGHPLMFTINDREYEKIANNQHIKNATQHLPPSILRL